MKKRTITLLDLKKIISENAYRILEQDDDLEDDSNLESSVDDSTPIDNGLGDASNDSISDNPESNMPYTNLSSAISNLANSIKDETKLSYLNDGIKKAVSSGKVSKDFTFDKMVSAGKDKNDFEYFITVLATLYKDADISEKKNIRDAILIALPPYQITSMESGRGEIRPSSLSNLIAKKAGVEYALKGQTIDSSYYLDIVVGTVYDAVDYALNNYDPSRGMFFTLFLYKAIGLTKDELGSVLHKRSFEVGGRKSSLDEPLGSSEEERDETRADRITGKEGEVSDKEKANVKEFAKAVQSFIRTKLSNPKLKNYLDYFNLFAKGHTSSEIADLMEITSGNARAIKKRMEDFITEFVKAGYLQQYIFDKTGIKAKFPNNEFFLSTQDAKEENKEVEPVEIFNITGTNPETGEPVGEWTEVIHKKDSNEPTYFDNYGSLINWSNKEDDEKKSDNEEQSINESLKIFIQNHISKIIK